MGKVSEDQMRLLQFVRDILLLVSESGECPLRESRVLDELYGFMKDVLEGLEAEEK